MGKLIEFIEMTYGNSFGWSEVVSIILLLSVFVEISPIKVNPIQKITTLLQKEINKKLDSIFDKLEVFSERIDKIEINNMRSSILSFGNSCMRGEAHTQEEFSHILATYDRYEKIIEETGTSNGQIDISIEYIKEVYKDCLIRNSFLKEVYEKKGHNYVED